MSVTAKKLKEALDQIPDTAELFIGSGRKEYPVEDVFVSCLGGRVIFATRGYANHKRKRDMVY